MREGLKSELKKWIVANIGKFETRREMLQEALERHLCTKRQFKDATSRLTRSGHLVLPPSWGTPKAPVPRTKRLPRFRVDVSEVKKEFDDESKLASAIDSLGTTLVKDSDFRVELSVNPVRWKHVSEKTKFAKSRIELKGKRYHGTYWGRPEVIQELRKAIDLL